MDRILVYSKMVAKLKSITVKSEKEIQENTEIYHDLKISGDDLSELLLWAEEHFGTQSLLNKFESVAPNESGEWRDELRVVFLKKSKFPSFTVQHLVGAIIDGRRQ